MKILYFGTVCDLENYNNILANCKVKPSVAPIVFESALLDGFANNNVSIEILSFPMMPPFPKSNLLVFGGKDETLKSGYSCYWLKTINIPIFKQISRRLDAKRRLIKWLKKNHSDGIILTYSIPPFLVKDILKYAKKYSVKTVAIVADLLRDMYINESKSSLITWLKQAYIKPAVKVQGKYDGYVYLTEGMKDIVAPNKPYIVMEGIYNTKQDRVYKQIARTQERAIMYAGMLHVNYGLINLLDAYEKLNLPNVKLWLFGDGTAVEEINRRCQHNPNIIYFGNVSRDIVLDYERKSTLLINTRNPNDEFTFYSFPSKIIEYMASGTPLLTTKLRGIPQEYYEYIFCVENNDIESLTNAIKIALANTDEQLTALGLKAQNFIFEEKNSKNQVSKIISFLKEVNNACKN